MARLSFPAPPKRVQLQQLRGSDTAGSRGGTQKTWTTIETVYASIMTVRASELVIGQQIEARATHTIEMHFTATMTPQTRIKHGEKFYQVDAINNVEQRDRWLIIQAIEVIV